MDHKHINITQVLNYPVSLFLLARFLGRKMASRLATRPAQFHNPLFKKCQPSAPNRKNLLRHLMFSEEGTPPTPQFHNFTTPFKKCQPSAPIRKNLIRHPVFSEEGTPPTPNINVVSLATTKTIS